MVAVDVATVVLLGVSSGFGSAFGVEIAKSLVVYLRGLKVVKRVNGHS